jgi:hypothetical protein
VRIAVLIVLHHFRAILVIDHSWAVPLHVKIAKKQVGPDVEAAIGDTSVADGCLVPGEDSSTGNVTGGRKLARYVLVIRRPGSDHSPPRAY